MHRGLTSLVASLALLGCAPAAPPSTGPTADEPAGEARPRPGRYAATIESSSGSCCSQSCGAHSTIANVSLVLREGGAAEATWTRRGCTVTLMGEGPLEMPYDPGGPEQVCRAEAEPGETRKVTSLKGEGRARGYWRPNGEVVLTDGAGPNWQLRCKWRAPPARSARPLLMCDFVDADWRVTAGLEVNGTMYLDDKPNLVVRAGGRDHGVPQFEYR